jgi:L-ascorbate metabolism protein UlaG (beta-lactamase superfamily)
MRIIWHSTAAVELVSERGRLLFDPFVPLRGSPVPVGIEEFDGFPDIFVTHGHFDHIISIPEIAARNPGVRIYCTRTPFDTLRNRGVPEEALRLIRFGDEIEAGGFRIRALHGKHAVLPKASLKRISYALKSPARGNLPQLARDNRACPENDESVFYTVEAGGKTVCLMGSLNLREEVDYPTGADLLILPYNGWDDCFPPAVSAIGRLSPRRVALDHYDDTFPPLTMPVDLTPILGEYGSTVFALELGKSVDV